MRGLILFVLLSVYATTSFADEPASRSRFVAGVRTNLLFDAAGVPNLGLEVNVGRGWSVAAEWNGAWWSNAKRDRSWRFAGSEVALHRWIGKNAMQCPLTGHRIGLFAQEFTYDFAVGKSGYLGGKPGGGVLDTPNYCFGVDYGYSLPLTKRLVIDFGLGVGYAGGRYYEYRHIDDCFVWQSTKQRRWFGPLKAEVALVWRVGKGCSLRKGGER